MKARQARRPTAVRPPARDLAAPSGGARRAKPATPSARPQPRRTAQEAEETGPADSPVSDLEGRWQSATSGCPGELPHRRALEARFGRSLAGVEVYAGAPARSLLDHLQARAAVRGQQIVLRDLRVDPVTLTHEVVHVLQGMGSDRAAGAPQAVVGASAAVEREAESIARQPFGGKEWPRERVPVRGRLLAGAIALRRTALPADLVDPALEELAAELRRKEPGKGASEKPPALEPEPASPAAEEAAGEAASANEESAVEPAELAEEPTDAVERRPSGRGGGLGRAARGGDEGEVRGRAPEEEEDRALEEEPSAPEGEEVVAAGGCVIDLRAPFDDLVGQVTDAWDAGAETAGAHTVACCPPAAVGEGRHPYATGPPEELPPLRTETPAEDPTLAPVDTTELEAKRAEVAEVMANAPAPEADSSGLTPEVDRERVVRARAMRREVDRELATGPEAAGDAPAVELTGTADPARARDDGAALAERVEAERSTAEAATREDFGEGRMDPHPDPELAHECDLEALAIPEVDAEAAVEEAARERLPTPDNVGHLTPEEVAVVRERDLASAEAALETEVAARARIDDEIAASDEAAVAACDEASRARAGLEEEASAGVEGARAAWSDEAEAHAAARAEEGERLVDHHVAHAERLRDDADARAGETMRGAEAEAGRRWDDTRDRAEDQAEEAGGRSLWQEAVNLVGALIENLRARIQAFIETCRRVVNALIAAARRVAHAIVSAAHAAVTRTFDNLRAGLDLIADNLPGELGRIARRGRDAIDVVLQGAQQGLDRWAAGFHDAIDVVADGLQTTLNDVLDAFSRGVDALAGGLNALLGEGLMAFLRASFPALADLLEEGLLAPVRRAGEALDGWVQGLLEQTGLLALEDSLAGLEREGFCADQATQFEEDLCEGFEALLGFLMGELDGLLASPAAQDVQQSIDEAQQQELDQGLDILADIFEFAQAVATDLLAWWDEISPAIAGLYQELGSFACGIWRHVAAFLDLPLDLDPITALRQKLNELWREATAAVQPIIDKLVEAWHWIRDSSVVQGLIELYRLAGEAWDALSELWDQVVAGGEEWLAELAAAAEENIFEPLRQLLGEVSRELQALVDDFARFARGLLRRIDEFIAGLIDIPILGALVRLLRTLTAPIRAALLVAFDCFVTYLRDAAGMVEGLFGHLRTLGDIWVGIWLAAAAPPLSFVTFLVGTVWTRLLPECFKEPILNFILDLLIRLVQFFPVPQNPLGFAMHRGATVFLQTLRDEDQGRKVRAVDLISRIFAGDVEIGAGMLVGALAGIWDSTVGLVIMLLQMVAWLIRLPLQALGIVESGGGEEDTAEGADAEGAEGETVEEPPPDTEAIPEDDTPDVAIGEPEEEEEDDGDPEAPESPGASPWVLDFTGPPQAPGPFGQIRDILASFVDMDLTRAGLDQMMARFRKDLAAQVEPMAQSAAEQLLAALTAEGAGYTVGYGIGYVFGIVLVTVLLAIFTGGASTAASGAQAGATTANVAGRGATSLRTIMQGLNRVRQAFKPLIDALRNFSPRLGRAIDAAEIWLDDLMRWMRNVGNRLRHDAAAMRELWGRLPGFAQRRLAAAAARELAWTGLSRDMGHSVEPHGVLFNRLVTMQAMAFTRVPAGFRPSFRAETDEGDEEWRLKVSVRPNWREIFRQRSAGGVLMQLVGQIHPTSARTDPAWLAADTESALWFTTAEDQSEKHRDAADEADEDLDDAARDPANAGVAPEEIDEALEDDVEREENAITAGLLRHIRFEIDEDSPEETTDEDGLPALLYHYVISPNVTRGSIKATVGGSASVSEASTTPWGRFRDAVQAQFRRQNSDGRGLARVTIREILDEERRADAEIRELVTLPADAIRDEGSGENSRYAVFANCGDRLLRIGDVARLANGSEERPIPMGWFKPLNQYPTVPLRPGAVSAADRRRYWADPPRSDNIDLPDVPATAGIRGRANIRVPNNKRRSLGVETTIGVVEDYRPAAGKIVKLVEHDERSGMQGHFRDLLAAYAWDWGGYEADHVQDLQWSGDDVVDNLWPLAGDKNRAGNQTRYQEVRWEDGHRREQVGAVLNWTNKYFRIRSVRTP